MARYRPVDPKEIVRIGYNRVGADFLCADMTALDLPPASFDAIFAFFSIVHVPVEDQPALLAAMHRWLRAGCWLMATLGAGRWTGIEENWLDAGATMYWSHEGADTNRRWLEEAGFEIEWERFVPEGKGGFILVLARA